MTNIPYVVVFAFIAFHWIAHFITLRMAKRATYYRMLVWHHRRLEQAWKLVADMSLGKATDHLSPSCPPSRVEDDGGELRRMIHGLNTPGSFGPIIPSISYTATSSASHPRPLRRGGA